MNNNFLIEGGLPLSGEVEISGYKHSAGAVLAASLLSKEPSIIDNLPLCSDVLNQIEILKKIGAKIEWLGEKKVKINTENIDPEKIPVDLFEKIRISVLLIGPLLTRFEKIKVPHPMGDRIGLRPITTHLKAFEKFGVKVSKKEGFYYFERPKKLVGKKIVLEEFSVSATQNIMMLASLAKGKTKIELAAAEPQVQDLGKFLEKMGVKISGVGTHTIEIEGKEKLKGAEFKVSPDLIEIGTFFVAFAITGGEGKIKNVNAEHLTAFLEKMKEIGVKFKINKDEILVKKSNKFKATKIQVLPYPGFLTDLQPIVSVLLTQAKGKSLIHEPLYENRFQHLHELKKMGADIEIIDPHRALIFGKTELIGTRLNSFDIRSGSSLVLAALAAKGKSIIEGVEQIDRGYENLDEKLRKLGAKIKRSSA
ncbi:MAG: UDP-N-acetylglucosamine 1-carboxyvinyltransferase [Patescibacteria group bacterium]